MNHYPSYPHTPSGGSGPPLPSSSSSSSAFPDARLPPRPPVPPPPLSQHQQQRNDYPSYTPSFPPGPPPTSQTYPYSGNQGPGQHSNNGHPGQSQSPVREQQRFGEGGYGNSRHGPGPSPGNASRYEFNQDQGRDRGLSGPDQYSPARSRQGHDQSNPPYPTLPPIHFTDRAPPPPPSSGNRYDEDRRQGYNAPFQNQNNAAPLPPPMREYGDRPRDNIRGQGERNDRGRSPDPSRRPPRPLGERDRDGRTIEARIQLERPCRTLFVRNVNYDADTDVIRGSFEKYGQVKTYFDLVKQRGMIFITYYDLRAAERARDGMHDSVVKNRKIDVHYSLPKADDQKGPADRESNQGCIVATLLRQPYLTENDLGRCCEQYGDVKSIRPGRSPEQKIVEYYDSRGTTLFFDQMNDRPFMNGTLQLRFIWDEPENNGPPPPPAPGYNAPSNHFNRERVGPPPRPDDTRGGRDDRHGAGRGDRGDRAGRGGRRSGGAPTYGEVRGGKFDDRRSSEGGPYERRGSDGNHNVGGRVGLPPAGRYDAAPPQSVGDDRLEQARKVQDLLASLSGSGSGIPPPGNNQNGYQPPNPVRPPPNQGFQPPPPSYRPGDPRQNNPSKTSLPPFPPTGNQQGPPPGPPTYNAGPPSSYPAPSLPNYNGSNASPGQRNYNYSGPNNNSPSGGGGPGGAGIPPEVLSLLQANNIPPPSLQQGYTPGPGPGQQGTLGQGQPFQPGNGQYRPPPPPPLPQTGYGQGGPQHGAHQGGYEPQQQGQGQGQGYQPGPGSGQSQGQGQGAKDVGSLLAMLQNNR